ncbi:hypothetical protein EV195_10921 [Tenacibaculum skagerrakense]|uniref:Uncharacterized protein n=1 Tax=Tenacibaculum skagerrakense TaxID=186571 RepID=A0A4R2NNN0_9FLAO|nr:hypothetical protein [Tenacibaculum skagerrakense]TCP23297.1 hypothetical protein EV195_10921 [Tenacibaculum skagerrakense]
MMLRKSTYTFLILWLISLSTSAQDSLILLNKKESFTVGESISLSFKNSTEKSYQMYCSTGYGTTLLSSIKNDNLLIFKFPEFVSNKTGVVSWKIVGLNTPISGKFLIEPVQKPNSLETYIGPPTIEAGGKDFTMAVIIPTDTLDNPIKTNSEVIVKKHVLQSTKNQQIYTNNLIAYLNIFSPSQTGRMTVSSESFGLNSKEYDVDILPAIGTNFKIFYTRNHEYADSNQITKFSTSIIKDKNNNIVSDGTFVDFYITNSNGNILKTSGTTINGVAEAFIVHPDCEDTWKVKAFIQGIANSDSITLLYKKAIEHIPITFSKDNRSSKVGPLQSFMNQMIPDGLKVQLTVYRNGKLEGSLIEQSKDGFATFILDSNIYKAGNYDLEITAACKTITRKSITLW